MLNVYLYSHVCTHKTMLAFKGNYWMFRVLGGQSPLWGPRAWPEAPNTEVAESKTWKILPAVVDMLNIFKSLTAYWN